MPGEVSTAHTATPGEFRVLVLPFTAADAQAIRRVLGANDIAAEICSSVTQLCLHLAAGAGLLIVSEEVLPGGADELAACVAGQPVWSDDRCGLRHCCRWSGRACAHARGNMKCASILPPRKQPSRPSAKVSAAIVR